MNSKGFKMILSESDFLKILHENQALIHKVCNIYRNNKADKEDLFQEITYQLWRSYSTFKGKSKITTWMYRIALNTAMASFRKQKIHISHVTQLPEQLAETYTEHPQKEKLFIAIRQLNDAEKAIISLYLDGFDNTEIANIIGITKNHVGVRLNRIKNKIKTLIE